MRLQTASYSHRSITRGSNRTLCRHPWPQLMFRTSSWSLEKPSKTPRINLAPIFMEENKLFLGRRAYDQALPSSKSIKLVKPTSWVVDKSSSVKSVSLKSMYRQRRLSLLTAREGYCSRGENDYKTKTSWSFTSMEWLEIFTAAVITLPSSEWGMERSRASKSFSTSTK